MKYTEEEKKKYNVLTNQIAQLNEFSEEAFSVVIVDPTVPGNVFEVKKGNYSIGGKKLKTILSLSGGKIESKSTEVGKDIIKIEAIIKFTSPLLSEVSWGVPEIYSIDINAIREDLLNDERKKNRNNVKYSPSTNKLLTEEQLMEIVNNRVSKISRYRYQMCETGVLSRIAKTIYDIKDFYTAEELKKSFLVQRLTLNINNPIVKAMVEKKATEGTKELFPTKKEIEEESPPQ